jgi:hypothetical protein
LAADSPKGRKWGEGKEKKKRRKTPKGHGRGMDAIAQYGDDDESDGEEQANERGFEVPPPVPEEEVDATVRARIEKLHINDELCAAHAFGNPLILEKLVAQAGIDERGTFLPRTALDLGALQEADFIEGILARLAREAEARAKSQAARTTIEFQKASRWDQPPHIKKSKS